MPDRHLWRRHSTKTITFDGTAGGGAAGTEVTVFTITGRVHVCEIGAFCTTDLTTTGAATIELGVTADTDAFIAQTVATTIDANEWWASATPNAGAATQGQNPNAGATTAAMDKFASTNIVLTIGTADVSTGVIVFDVIYDPLTDGARLA